MFSGGHNLGNPKVLSRKAAYKQTKKKATVKVRKEWQQDKDALYLWV